MTDLSGVKILIDVGHGGMDPGASGSNRKFPEAERNLNLAKKIGSELLKTGATVYLTRTTDKTSTTDDKITMLKRIKPDLCVCIHHDSNNSSRLNGFGGYYYHPFSKKAAESVFYAIQNTGSSIYNKFDLKWHYYFVARASDCPVVLTENGYMSNKSDYANILNETKNTEKAKAITTGIVDYFNSIQ